MDSNDKCELKYKNGIIIVMMNNWFNLNWNDILIWFDNVNVFFSELRELPKQQIIFSIWDGYQKKENQIPDIIDFLVHNLVEEYHMNLKRFCSLGRDFNSEEKKFTL